MEEIPPYEPGKVHIIREKRTKSRSVTNVKRVAVARKKEKEFVPTYVKNTKRRKKRYAAHLKHPKDAKPMKLPLRHEAVITGQKPPGGRK